MVVLQNVGYINYVVVGESKFFAFDRGYEENMCVMLGRKSSLFQ